jgi:hypothetical protein
MIANVSNRGLLEQVRTDIHRFTHLQLRVLVVSLNREITDWPVSLAVINNRKSITINDVMIWITTLRARLSHL